MFSSHCQRPSTVVSEPYVKHTDVAFVEHGARIASHWVSEELDRRVGLKGLT